MCSNKASLSYSDDDINLNKVDSQFASVKNGRIEYYQFGSGSPLILIPGYLTDISSWNRIFLTKLAKRHQVFVLNNRNVGGSVIQSTSTDSNVAEDVDQFIQVMHLKKPTILGLSMGGMIAQQFAVNHPNHLNKLILINTAIAGHQSIHPTALVEKKLLNMPKNILGCYFLAVDLFFPQGWKIKMAYSLIVDRFQPQNYIMIDPDKVREQQQHFIRQWSKDEAAAKKLAKFNLPVLILNGEADSVIPPLNSDILSHNYAHAHLVRWQDGGHGMIYQYPNQVADEINQFMLTALSSSIR